MRRQQQARRAILDSRCLLRRGADNHMRVGATDAETADPGQTPTPLGPGPGGGGYVERRVLQIDLRIDPGKPQVGWDHPVKHGKRRANQPDHAGSRAQMTHLTFH